MKKKNKSSKIELLDPKSKDEADLINNKNGYNNTFYLTYEEIIEKFGDLLSDKNIETLKLLCKKI